MKRWYFFCAAAAFLALAAAEYFRVHNGVAIVVNAITGIVLIFLGIGFRSGPPSARC